MVSVSVSSSRSRTGIIRTSNGIRMMTLVALSMVMLISLLSYVSATANELYPILQPRTLVLYDVPTILQTHSQYFQYLNSLGHRVTYASAMDDLKLQRYGEFNYDNLIIFAPTTPEFGRHLTIKDIISFSDSGRSVILGFGMNTSESVRFLAAELGVFVDEDSTGIIDHFNYDAESEYSNNYGSNHSIILTNNVIDTEAIISRKRLSAPIAFRGIGHNIPSLVQSLSEGPATLLPKSVYLPILYAKETAYSHSFTSTFENNVENSLLVSAYQSQTNTRVLFVGSVEMFSNEFFSRPIRQTKDRSGKSVASSNEAFCTAVTSWAFHEHGLIRAVNLTHHLREFTGELNPERYRVSDELTFSIYLQEWDVYNQAWKPYIADDVQLQLVMLDPAIRVTVKNVTEAGKYTVDLTAPDVYGVYKFVLHYRHAGYSTLYVEQQVSITPFRHDQFERFLFVAYPYYITGFSLMAAFFLFGISFLYQK